MMRFRGSPLAISASVLTERGSLRAGHRAGDRACRGSAAGGRRHRITDPARRQQHRRQSHRHREPGVPEAERRLPTWWMRSISCPVSPSAAMLARAGRAPAVAQPSTFTAWASNRNLVLLDGKRLPISDISGNVDVNILPDAIIEGVDAITGGASAVYGSDAMSGVVNFQHRAFSRWRASRRSVFAQRAR